MRSCAVAFALAISVVAPGAAKATTFTSAVPPGITWGAAQGGFALGIAPRVRTIKIGYAATFSVAVRFEGSESPDFLISRDACEPYLFQFTVTTPTGEELPDTRIVSPCLLDNKRPFSNDAHVPYLRSKELLVESIDVHFDYARYEYRGPGTYLIRVGTPIHVFAPWAQLNLTSPNIPLTLIR
jgi:hypothetical protein